MLGSITLIIALDCGIKAIDKVAYAKEKYPKISLYSIREIEAFEGLEVLEQKMLQEAKQIFGGAIFTEETFNNYYPKRKGTINGKKQRV